MNEKRSVRVLMDWGGTIIRDHLLFNEIAYMSENQNALWEDPQSWEIIRQIGSKNYFDENINNFFSMGEEYTGAIEVISKFCGNKGRGSVNETFVVYDNNPDLKKEPSQIVQSLAFEFANRGGKVNGFYVDKDKTSLCKKNDIDIIVEDDPRIIISLALSGVCCIFMIREWNCLNWDSLKITIKKEKFQKLLYNLYVAEDWKDVESLIPAITGRIIESRVKNTVL